MKLFIFLLVTFFVSFSIVKADPLTCYECEGEQCDNLNDGLLKYCGPDDEPNTTDTTTTVTDEQSTDETTDDSSTTEKSSSPTTESSTTTTDQEVSTTTDTSSPTITEPDETTTTDTSSPTTTTDSDTSSSSTTTDSDTSSSTTTTTDPDEPTTTDPDEPTTTDPDEPTTTTESDSSSSSTRTTNTEENDSELPQENFVEPQNLFALPKNVKSSRTALAAARLIRNYRSIGRYERAVNDRYACYTINVPNEANGSTVKRGCVNYSATQGACPAIKGQLSIPETFSDNCKACLMPKCNGSGSLKISAVAILFVAIAKFLI